MRAASTLTSGHALSCPKGFSFSIDDDTDEFALRVVHCVAGWLRLFDRDK